MRHTLRQWAGRSRDGTASIEFAVFAPLLMLMVFAGVDYGMFTVKASWLSAATTVASEYARTQPTCIQNGMTPCGQATSFAYNYTNAIPGATLIFLGGTVSCTCADNSAETTSCPPSGAVSPCTGITVNGVSDARVFIYDSVTMTIKGYQPLFDFGFLGSSFFAAVSTLRVQ
jgi:Flp pilus assembly protein TadG